ncbi:peptide ABC transporter substrate-binding protein [Paracoccus tegillarcae]|uniref:Oligopeptide ABC transporter substrate-binding protein OppA n=1 Tax=Paracoccus tegillarcae TaxID=1529068 RepID=A0A2K9EZP4_9RHOB|nr:peptide ABC transporter substrate-binding protein [Paracoccus tegillarcae]AUH34784.1 oligopeptide ABC transporter substrate-binding protein OppA [Paracoccus tegillarcae]
MTKFLATTALAFALALPAHAAQVAEGDTLADNQEMSFWILDAIKSLDPHKNTDVSGAHVLRQLFEGLMNEDEKGAMVPGLAESHEVSEDGLTYTFKLRDANWSNGEPITAGDFVYSWQRAVTPETASEYAWFMELMNIVNATAVVKGEMAPDQLGVKAVDDKTFEVTLSTPTPYFIKTLSHTTTFPVPQAVVEEFGDNWTQPANMVSNGAYKLDSHDLGVQLTVSTNDEYWDAENTILSEVEFITVNDQNVALTRYEAGELNWFNRLPAGQYPRLLEQYPDQVSSVPMACSYAYIFNLSEKGPEALKDLKVRQALAYGMDRDIVVEKILQGGQRPAYFWTPESIEGFVAPEIEMAGWSQPERIEKAKALLEEAGYGPDNPLSLTVQYNTSEDHKKIAVAAQQFWKGIGVDVTLNNVEWKVHTDRLQNQDFEIARYAWCGDYNEASTFLDWFRTDGYNSGKWSNAEFDQLLADAKTSDNAAELYTQAEEVLYADLPYVPVYHYANAQIVNADLRGVPYENVMDNWYAKDMYRVAE